MAYPMTPGPLTPRQLVVLREYAQLASQKEVGQRLGIQRQSVKEHLRRAYYRLDAENAIEAFRALGWLNVPDAA